MLRPMTTFALVFGLLALQCAWASSSASTATEPRLGTFRIQIWFGRALQSFRGLISHIRHQSRRAWSHIVSAVSQMSNRGRSRRPASASSAATTLPIVPPIASHLHDPHRRAFLDEHGIELVVGDAAGYESVGDFVVTRYGIGAVLEAIRSERFLDNICINGAENVCKGVWETEGPWHRRPVHGKVRKNPLIQPTFKQMHRYGYATESSAVYVANQEVEVMSARICITFRIQLDQLFDAAAVRVRTSLKIDSSGPWLITSRARPQALHHARRDYRQAETAIMEILDSGLLVATPGDAMLPEPHSDLERSRSSASLATNDRISDPIADLQQAHGPGPWPFMAARQKFALARSALAYLMTLLLAMMAASCRLTRAYRSAPSS